jgi:hypothetical protein
MVFATVSMPTVANAKKKYHGHGYGHHHHYKHNKYRGVGAAVAAGVVIAGTAAYYECKKWKNRYNRTGNPYYLDRYYACKY